MPWSFLNLLCGLGSKTKGENTGSYSKMDSNLNEVRSTKSSRMRREYISQKYPPSPPAVPRPSSTTRKGHFRPPNKQTYRDEKENSNSQKQNVSTPYEVSNTNFANQQFRGSLPGGNSSGQDRQNSWTAVGHQDSSSLRKTLSQEGSRNQPDSKTVQRDDENSNILHDSEKNGASACPESCGKRGITQQVKDSSPQVPFNKKQEMDRTANSGKRGCDSSSPIIKEMIPKMSDEDLRRETRNIIRQVGFQSCNPAMCISDKDNFTHPKDANSESSQAMNNIFQKEMVEKQSDRILRSRVLETTNTSNREMRERYQGKNERSKDNKHDNLHTDTGHTYPAGNNSLQKTTLFDANRNGPCKRNSQTCSENTKQTKLPPRDTFKADLGSLPVCQGKSHQEQEEHHKNSNADVVVKKQHNEHHKDLGPSEAQKTVQKPQERLMESSSKTVKNNTDVCSTRDKISEKEQNARGKQQEAQNSKLFYLQTKYFCSREKDLDIYKPLLDHRKDTGSVEIGDKKNSSSEKVILLVGGAGAGKTTWINGLINYIYGTEWDNDYRIKLIEEKIPGKRQNQAKSQTKKITSYTIHHEPWFTVPFSVTVIDTPGFGDTEGIQKDKEIKEQIGSFFTAEGHNGINHIDAIGFVIQSSLVRLTPSQRYLFNSILSLFGKNVANNIFMLLTFADVQKPQVLNGINEAVLPYATYFKFNNSVLYVNNKEETSDAGEEGADKSFDRMFWKMGIASYRKFLNAMQTMEPRSLVLTQEVLRERRHLEAKVESIHQKIKVRLMKQEELTIEKDLIKKYDIYNDEYKNVVYETPTPVIYRRETNKDVLVTSCHGCHMTCDPVCSAKETYIMNDGHCMVCPGKCPSEIHSSCHFIYSLGRKKSIRKIKGLKRRFEGTTRTKLTPVEIIENDLHSLNVEIGKLVEEARNCLEKLREKALRPNPLSTTDYIDLMIEEEEYLAGPGWKESVRQLEKIKDDASIMKMLQKDHANISTEDQSSVERKEDEGSTELKEPTRRKETLL